MIAGSADNPSLDEAIAAQGELGVAHRDSGTRAIGTHADIDGQARGVENTTSRVVVKLPRDIATVALVCNNTGSVVVVEVRVGVMCKRINQSAVGFFVGQPTDAVDAFTGCLVKTRVVVPIAGVVAFNQHLFHVGSDVRRDVAGSVGGHFTGFVRSSTRRNKNENENVNSNENRNVNRNVNGVV